MNQKEAIILPIISEEERTPLVDELLSIIKKLQKQTETLQSEINRLKKHKGKPKLRASTLGKKDKGAKAKRGKPKHRKTEQLKIHETQIIEIDKDVVPEGSKFKGYKNYVVQDLEIKSKNTLFKLVRWRLRNGEYITAQLPDGYKGRHFGPTLRSYVLHQHHHQGVTQPLLLDQLRELGVKMSSGQLSQLITEKQEAFHQEKQEVLKTGLTNLEYIQADDTGARHQGKNGVCTHIGNEDFAFFESTNSKSRINFLKLLHFGKISYCLDLPVIEQAISKGFNYYLCWRIQNVIEQQPEKVSWFYTEEEFQKFLRQWGFNTVGRIRNFSEWALLQSLEHRFGYQTLSLITDEAKQFDFPQFAHGLCWLHVERKINELVPDSKKQIKELNSIRKRFWNLYYSIKKYKLNPHQEAKKRIEVNFRRFVKTKIKYTELSDVLERIAKLKSGLLLALDRPNIPLHNNLSESDIREYVKKRKISGSTRSDEGRRCRDTFASLKKTCKKQGIKFWNYLLDRISQTNKIDWLPHVVEQNLKRKYGGKLVATST